MADNAIIEKAKKALVAQDKEGALEIVKKYISDGQNPMDLMNRSFIPGINEVGEQFGRGRLFLPELMVAADVMKSVTDVINAALEGGTERLQNKGTIVIATVKGDVHDIGKCIVVSLLRANGFTVHDMGRDVDTEAIINEARKVNADIIGTSALLTTTMSRQKEIEQGLAAAGLKGRIKTIVGGAPVTHRWASRIGADAYAEDAQDGVNKVKELLAQ